jgi:hypothetical protein
VRDLEELIKIHQTAVAGDWPFPSDHPCAPALKSAYNALPELVNEVCFLRANNASLKVYLGEIAKAADADPNVRAIVSAIVELRQLVDELRAVADTTRAELAREIAEGNESVSALLMKIEELTMHERNAVQAWKDANGYDDLIAAFSSLVIRAERLERELLAARADRAVVDLAYDMSLKRATDTEIDRMLKWAAKECAEASKIHADDLVRDALAVSDALRAEGDALDGRIISRLADAYEAARADLARVTGERDALQRHYDAASPEHNLLALLDLYFARAEKAETERDARPEISVEDAVLWGSMADSVGPVSDAQNSAWKHIREALRAHAKRLAAKGAADV